jgi:hypothetical protein
MLKTPRARNIPSQSSSSRSKRVLRLAPETVRTLTSDELPQAAGGSCPNGSWPTTIDPEI